MQAVQQLGSRVSKQSIFKVVVVVYIILSAAYILITQFQTYQVQLAQEAYLQGRVATIEELISQAESSCQPFPVYSEDKQIELINLSCLVAAEGSQTSEQVPAQSGSE
jgi:hypothetical protein